MLYHDMWGGVTEVNPYAATTEDAAAYKNIFPQHQGFAKSFINLFLGYIPFEASYYAPEVSIREIIENWPNDVASNNAVIDKIYKVVMLIRNDDMKRAKWCDVVKLDEEGMRLYNETHMLYIRPARDRLARLIGYYPALKYSYDSEIYIRSAMSHDDYVDNPEATSTDIRAITALHYREDLFDQGKEAADNSPLPGLYYTKPMLSKLNPQSWNSKPLTD